jgi:hypothetical protein
VHAYGGADPDWFRIVSNRATGSVNGEGADNQLNFSCHKRAVRVDVGAARATWKGGAIRFHNIDNILGSIRKDLMLGGPGNDFLIGKGGFDNGDGGPGWDICLTETKIACP